MIRRYRDLMIIEEASELDTVIACDVSASIGEMAGDVLKVPGEIVGYYAAFVPIIEILAVGAKPLAVVDTLIMPLKPHGEAIISGVLEAMNGVGLGREALTGSTEDNMPTSQTGIGITIIGKLTKQSLENHKPAAGQWVYLVGIPKVGSQFFEEEILEKRGEVMTLTAMRHLRQMPEVGHILPIGSRGVWEELVQLTDDINLTFRPMALDPKLDMKASAGPATCALVCCEQLRSEDIQRVTGLPVYPIAVLTNA